MNIRQDIYKQHTRHTASEIWAEKLERDIDRERGKRQLNKKKEGKKVKKTGDGHRVDDWDKMWNMMERNGDRQAKGESGNNMNK